MIAYALQYLIKFRCIVCSEVPAGVVRQAYHCRGCLIDVCRGCVGDLPNFVPICPGASSNIKEKRSLKNFTLGRKALKEKREKYRPTASSKLSIVQRKRAATNWGGQQKTMGTAKLSGSGGTDDTCKSLFNILMPKIVPAHMLLRISLVA